MPASLAVRAHWSVSQPVALKKLTSVTPGVHSLPENVLNDQQMNMPQRSALQFLGALGHVHGVCGRANGPAADTARKANVARRIVLMAYLSAVQVRFCT